MTVNLVVELDQINRIVMIRVESRIHALGSSSPSLSLLLSRKPSESLEGLQLPVTPGPRISTLLINFLSTYCSHVATSRYFNRVISPDEYDVDAEATDRQLGENNKWRSKSGVKILQLWSVSLLTSLLFLRFHAVLFFCVFPTTMIRYTIRRQLTRLTSSSNVGRRHVHAPSVFNWEDPLDSASLFTEEEIAIQESANSYCQERMLPRVLGSQKSTR